MVKLWKTHVRIKTCIVDNKRKKIYNRKLKTRICISFPQSANKSNEKQKLKSVTKERGWWRLAPQQFFFALRFDSTSMEGNLKTKRFTFFWFSKREQFHTISGTPATRLRSLTMPIASESKCAWLREMWKEFKAV